MQIYSQSQQQIILIKKYYTEFKQNLTLFLCSAGSPAVLRFIVDFSNLSRHRSNLEGGAKWGNCSSNIPQPKNIFFF